MKSSIKAVIFVLTAILSSLSISAAWADDFISGEIIEADRVSRMIVINDVEGILGLFTIIGFPFDNLEKQLDDVLDPLYPEEEGITIEEGDCVTVEYYEKLLASGEVVNKWEALTAYCEECTQTEPCYEDEDPMTRAPGQNRPKPPPWAGKPGKHPGTP